MKIRILSMVHIEIDTTRVLFLVKLPVKNKAVGCSRRKRVEEENKEETHPELSSPGLLFAF